MTGIRRKMERFCSENTLKSEHPRNKSGYSLFF